MVKNDVLDRTNMAHFMGIKNAIWSVHCKWNISVKEET